MIRPTRPISDSTKTTNEINHKAKSSQLLTFSYLRLRMIPEKNHDNSKFSNFSFCDVNPQLQDAT